MDINKDTIKMQNSDKKYHLYEVAIDEQFKDNPQFADVVKTMVNNKLETMAQITLLEKLLIDKKLVTQSEIDNVMLQKNIIEVMQKLQTIFDEQLFVSTAKNKT